MTLPRPIAERTAEAIGSHLHAIGQPVRIRLLDELDREGEQPVSALAQAIDQSLHNTSQHLAVLLQAGAVVRRRRGREVCYALADTTAPAIYELVAQRLAELANQRSWPHE